MESYITGGVIKKLRKKRKITQNELADMVGVSDKAVSKWETGKGLPDISLIEPLSEALCISAAELIAGKNIENTNKTANMRKMKFYICPICGNVICSTGEIAVSCCGITLPPQEAEKADSMHPLSFERVDDEYYIHIDHEMTKEHYITFIAYLTSDGCNIKKLYAEGSAEASFLIQGHGLLLAYCKKHGLFSIEL